MFRPDHPLLPNYKHLPIAYHGRASSIVVSGTAVRRPLGQLGEGLFGPSGELDYELELGAFLGPGNRMGEPIPIDEAEEHVAGVCLLNDWSARDIQRWEYQPLGPFLGKNFATSISPWLITLEALEPFRVAPMEHDVPVLPYLQAASFGAFDITLEVWLRSASMREASLVSHAFFKDMYWTLAQMVAHHASNGCPLRAGDLIGSFAGLRVLPGGAGHAFHRSRETQLVLDRPARPRVLSIYGGKLTTWRAVSQRALRLIAASLPRPRRQARTDRLHLR